MISSLVTNFFFCFINAYNVCVVHRISTDIAKFTSQKLYPNILITFLCEAFFFFLINHDFSLYLCSTCDFSRIGILVDNCMYYSVDCIGTYYNVRGCAQMCEGVFGYVWVCTSVLGCVHECARVRGCARVCARVCMDVLGCVRV